eukprot:gene33474-43260_t
MAIVDITGSILVLIFWQGNGSSAGTDRESPDKIRELQFSYVIGSLMMLLGIFLILDSVSNLVEGKSPHDSVDSVDAESSISIFGTTVGFILAIYKYNIGKELDSPVIMADSLSSFCAGLASFVALVVSYNSHLVWWLDGFCGLLVAFYTLYSGATTMMSSSLEQSKLRVGNVSPTYINLMNRFRQSYQNESSLLSYSLEDSMLKGTDRSMLEIMQSEPTPYNSEEKDVFTVLLGSLYERFVTRLNPFARAEHSGDYNPATGYDRIPNQELDQEDELFSA